MAKIKTKNGYNLDSEKKAIETAAYNKHKPPKLTGSGDNAVMLKHNLEIAYMNKIDYHNPEQVRSRTIDYFILCQEHDVKPSIAGYALALGTNRGTLTKWLNGQLTQNPEVLEIVSQAYSVLNALMEDYLQNNQINAVAGIFLSKNNFGYVDVSQSVSITVEAKTDIQKLVDEAKLLPD